MTKLGVNIDHVATLRQARGENEPDPLEAARVCERAGADSIVCHLREDQRHIKLADVKALRKMVRTRLNLEMSLNKDIVALAAALKPDEATLVPERRQELTTEGGLDVVKYFRRVEDAVAVLSRRKIIVSLFIDPEEDQIARARAAGAPVIELHTGRYALARTPAARDKELKILRQAARFARLSGLTVNAGHGLKYHNTRDVARIPGIEELNIGHTIVARAVFVGLERAVKEMIAIVR